MPPILQQINKATGYTPNMGAGGGPVYAAPPSAGNFSVNGGGGGSSNSGGGGSSGGGGGRSGGSSAPAVNPFTASFLASLPGQLGGIHSGADAAAASAHAGLTGGVRDLVAQLKIDQNNIDQQGIQNELAKQQGTAGVLSMIQHGLQSGGVSLANKGASTSSAAEALARAYSDIGRRSQSQVGQQYSQGQHTVGVAQTNFNTNKNAKVGDIGDQKTQAINQIVTNAQNQLSYLAAQAASASVPGKVNIQAEMDGIRGQATSALADIDQILSSGVNSVVALGPDEQRAQAAQERSQGVAAAAPFTYSTTPPAQFQDSGPFASELPIFTLPGSKKQQG